MVRDDTVGAEAAAQYFLQLFPYVYATGDLSEWKEMSEADCVYCQSVVDNVTELHADGGYGVGPEFTVEVLDVQPPLEGNDYFAVWIEGREGYSATVGGNGDVLTEFGGGRRSFDFAVTNKTGAWVVGEGATETIDD